MMVPFNNKSKDPFDKKFKKWYDDSVMNLAASMANYCKKANENAAARMEAERMQQYEREQRDKRLIKEEVKFFNEKCFPGLQNDGFKLAAEPGSAITHIGNYRVICNFVVKTFVDGMYGYNPEIGEIIVQEYKTQETARFRTGVVPGWNTIRTFPFEKPTKTGSWEAFNKNLGESMEFCKTRMKEDKVKQLKEEAKKGLE